jgi:hypothetical protein
MSFLEFYPQAVAGRSPSGIEMGGLDGGRTPRTSAVASPPARGCAATAHGARRGSSPLRLCPMLYVRAEGFNPQPLHLRKVEFFYTMPRLRVTSGKIVTFCLGRRFSHYSSRLVSWLETISTPSVFAM